MFELPTTITIGNKEYPVRNKGDYRMVLDCFKVLNDEELDTSSRVLTCLVIFYEDMRELEDINNFGEDLKVAIEEMFRFFRCGEEDDVGATTNNKLVDWEEDTQLIASAINSVVKLEVRGLEYLHWWTFMGYYLAIGESAFSTVVSIRNKIHKGKKLEKYEQEFRKNNPKYFRQKKTKEEKAFEENLRNLWDNGGT